MHRGGDSSFDDRPAKRIKVEAPLPPPRDTRPHDSDVDGSPYYSPRSLLSPPPAAGPAAGEADAPPPFPLPSPSAHIGRHHRQHPQAPGLLPRPLRPLEHAGPTGISMVAPPTVPNMSNPASALFDASWKWPPPYTTMPPPPTHMAVALDAPPPDLHLDAAHLFPAPLKLVDPGLAVSISQANELKLPLAGPVSASLSLASSLPSKRPRYPFLAADDSTSRDTVDQTKDGHSQGRAQERTLISPFKDCVGNFGEAQQRRFDRPIDGKVNGYIKFNWPKDKFGRHPSNSRGSFVLDPSSVIESADDIDKPSSLLTHRSSAAASMTLSPDLDSSLDFSCFLYGPAPSFEPSHCIEAGARTVGADSSIDWAPIGAPQKGPKALWL